jgi:hypothetical protein
MTVRFANGAFADLQFCNLCKVPFDYTVTDCKSVTVGYLSKISYIEINWDSHPFRLTPELFSKL